MRESQIEKYLVDRVRELGGATRKVKWIERSGAPDRLVMLPSIVNGCVTDRTIWIELKAEGLALGFPRNAHERTQHREHVLMRKMGQIVLVLDSYAGIDEALA